MNKEDRKDLVERLLDISRGDHERGCNGRSYTCSCGYDEESWKAAEEAADEIDRLTRELSEARKALVDASAFIENIIEDGSETEAYDRAFVARLRAALRAAKGNMA